MKITIRVLLLFCFISFESFGQQKEGANWLFGGWSAMNQPGTHINFSGQNPASAPFFYDHNQGFGTATISDKNGQLLFFSSNGHIATRQVVNNKYLLMPNGNVYAGNNMGSYNELIVQSPGNDQIYNIFFVTGPGNSTIHHLYVAQVDMRLNNGFGDVVPNSFQLLKRKIGPGMAAMLHANNRDCWLVTQNDFGDSLSAFLVSSTGVAAPVSSKLSNNKRLHNGSFMKGSPNSEMLTSFTIVPAPKVEVLQFNRLTGTVSDLYSLSLPNTAQRGFSYCFSPNSSKLYIGTYATPGNIANIYQFDLSLGNPQQVQQSIFSVFSTLSSHFIVDMQVAINGKIYVSRSDTTSTLSVINCPDLPGAASNFQFSGIGLSQNLGGGLLPSLNQNIFRNAGTLQAQAVRDTICEGEAVQLSAFGAGASRFRWQPANGLAAPSDTLADPVVNPVVTTTYTVTGYSLCDSRTATVTVVVVPKPNTVSIGGAASVCPQVQGIWYKAINPQRQQITWGVKGGSIATVSNDSISVDWGNASNSAKVWVISRNDKGCLSDTIFFPVNINLILATETPKGPDTLCLASAQHIAYRIGSTTGSVYNWGISGGGITAGQGTATVRVNWSQPGIGKLWVHEESQTSTSLCRGLSDTLRVLVHPSPATALTISGPVQVFTLTENQEYRLLNGDPGSSFNWTVNGGEITSGQGSSSIKVNWGSAGNGSVKVTEMNQNGCPGKEAAFMVMISGSPQPVFYNIITPNNDGLNDVFVVENLKWFPENELQIFNRWGTEVYRSTNYRNDWKGEKLSSGVYYYFFLSGGQSWKGWVEVMK